MEDGGDSFLSGPEPDGTVGGGFFDIEINPGLFLDAAVLGPFEGGGHALTFAGRDVGACYYEILAHVVISHPELLFRGIVSKLTAGRIERMNEFALDFEANCLLLEKSAFHVLVATAGNKE